MKYSGLLVIMIFLIGCSTKNDVPIKMELHDNWEFKKVRDTLWNLATVPGNIHSDLLENKLINIHLLEITKKNYNGFLKLIGTTKPHFWLIEKHFKKDI